MYPIPTMLSVRNGGGDLQSKVLNSSENKLRVEGGNRVGLMGFRRFEQTWTKSLLLHLQS